MKTTIIQFFTRFTNAAYQIVASPDDTPQTQLRKTIVMLAAIFGIMMNLTTSASYYLLDQVAVSIILLIYTLFIAVTVGWYTVFRRGLMSILLANMLANLIVAFSTTVAAGGIVASGGNILWGLIVPVLMLLVNGINSAIRWFTLYIVFFLLAILHSVWFPSQSLPPVPIITASIAVNFLGISTFVFGSLIYFVYQRDEAYQLLQIEQGKTEALLRNVLPDEIATILKDENRTIADHFDEASVLFADIADFTPLSAELGAVELVNLLNETFTAFDALVAHYDLEKIKTIGDCYMVAAGVPVPRADHALVLAQLALDMRDLVAAQMFNGRYLQFRIGINSGPLVAGVIGQKKFVYDLWGDTVNTASRMESYGMAGQIQVTQETYELVNDTFLFSAPRQIEVKGKGMMNVYFLEGGKG